MGWGAWGYCLHRGGYDMPHANGAGSIAVHATDALRFGYCLLHQGRWGDRQLVPAEYVALCNKPLAVQPALPVHAAVREQRRRPRRRRPAGCVLQVRRRRLRHLRRPLPRPGHLQARRLERPVRPLPHRHPRRLQVRRLPRTPGADPAHALQRRQHGRRRRPPAGPGNGLGGGEGLSSRDRPRRGELRVRPTLRDAPVGAKPDVRPSGVLAPSGRRGTQASPPMHRPVSRELCKTFPAEARGPAPKKSFWRSKANVGDSPI